MRALAWALSCLLPWAAACTCEPTPAPTPEPTPAPEPTPTPHLTRRAGGGEPDLAPGAPVPLDQPIVLEDGSLWVMDGEGVRFTLYGPGRFVFTAEPEPALLVDSGVFSLERGASAPRGVVATVAMASQVVQATGPCRLVGRATDAGVVEGVVTVVSGSAVAEPGGARLTAGQLLAAGQPTPRLLGGGTVESTALTWLRLPPRLPSAQAGARAEAAAALEAAVQAFVRWEPPTRGRGEPALAYRKRLALAAAERMRARRDVVLALLRDRAATLAGAGPEARRRQSAAMAALAEGAR